MPTAAWIAVVAVATGDYRWQTAVFLNGLTGPDRWSDDWQFWFLEALVWCYVGLAALVAVPWVDRWSRRSPFAVACPFSLSAWSSATRWWASRPARRSATRPWCVLWCVALGWAAATADTRRCAGWSWPPRQCVSVVGFFGDAQREVIVLVGVLLLLLDRAVPLPRLVAGAVQVVAAASLWIYLTQWQVYPGLEDAGHPYAAVLAALAVGIVAHLAWGRVDRLLRVRATRNRIRMTTRISAMMAMVRVFNVTPQAERHGRTCGTYRCRAHPASPRQACVGQALRSMRPKPWTLSGTWCRKASTGFAQAGRVTTNRHPGAWFDTAT